jgi:cytochrome o ubiquinol oxidase subunit III
MNAVTPRVDAAYPAAPVHHAPQETQAFGFWMYILSDLILFSALFATFAVQMRSFAGGPSGRDLFDLPYVAVETALLLLSSAGYGQRCWRSRGVVRAGCCSGWPSPSCWACASS